MLAWAICISGVVDTHQNDLRISCSPETSETSDMFVWFFSNFNGIMDQQLIGGTNNKYVTDDGGRTVIVRNVSIREEGLYYCRRRRNGNLELVQLPGACLFVYGKWWLTETTEVQWMDSLDLKPEEVGHMVDNQVTDWTAYVCYGKDFQTFSWWFSNSAPSV